MTTYLTCTDCGATDQRTVEQDTAGGLIRIRQLECAYCGAEGEVFEQLDNYNGGADVTVRDGPFAELTADGLQSLRENLDDPAFAPVR